MSLSQSSDLSKVKEHPLNSPSLKNSHQEKYGKMKVLLETDRILITLGSDYICLIASFVCFLTAGIYLIVEVNQAFEGIWFKIANLLFVLFQLLSYLAIAVSNPGIVLQQTLSSSQDKESVERQTQIQLRTCRICNIRMAKRMHHCKYCDVLSETMTIIALGYLSALVGVTFVASTSLSVQMWLIEVQLQFI